MKVIKVIVDRKPQSCDGCVFCNYASGVYAQEMCDVTGDDAHYDDCPLEEVQTDEA